MAELPGWTRDRLETAPPADVAAARWLVFARQWKALLGRDLAAEMDDLEVARTHDAKAIERHENRRNAEMLEGLVVISKVQAEVRARLGLEPMR